MATTAVKTESGKWHCQVSYFDSAGKKHFRSFTGIRKTEVEAKAREFEGMKSRVRDVRQISLGECIDEYIEAKEHVLSPTTIRSYRTIRRNSFQSLMPVKLKMIDDRMLNQAVKEEMMRKTMNVNAGTMDKVPSPKSIRNAYGLISASLAWAMPDMTFHVDLPKKARVFRDLPSPDEIYRAVKGSWVELPVLLAMWMTLSMSEIRGLTKSKSINGDYLTVREVVVLSGAHEVRKALGKTAKRNRRHIMPKYIKEMIEKVDGDIIVPQSASGILDCFQRKLRENGIDEITFHDLRHVSASVMAQLGVPNIYAQDRGGWASDCIMKQVYMETFGKERRAVDALINVYFEGFLDS